MEDKEDNNKKSSKAKITKSSIPKTEIRMGKLNDKTGEVESITEEDLSEEEREKLAEGLLGALEGLRKKIEDSQKQEQASPIRNMKMEMAQQELNMASHEVERRKILTLFDTIMNTKELLVQRINETGKSDFQHSVSEKTKIGANNIINLCQKQIYLWLEKNDINGVKSGVKPTNPDDIINKDLY